MILALAAISCLLGGVVLLLVAGTSMLRVADLQRGSTTAGLGNLGAALVVLGTIPFAHQGDPTVVSWAVVVFLLVRGFVNRRLLTRLSPR